jgi:hypothetical protein
VDRRIEHAHHRFEPLRQPPDQLQQLTLCPPLFQVRGEVEDLVALGHERRAGRTLTDWVAGLKLVSRRAADAKESDALHTFAQMSESCHFEVLKVKRFRGRLTTISSFIS